MVERQSGHKLKVLKIDGGGEFTSREFGKYCDDEGIVCEVVPPYTPQQNGVAERKNRTIMNIVRNMLKWKNLPKELWGEAVATAAYVLNRCPTKKLEKVTPEEENQHFGASRELEIDLPIDFLQENPNFQPAEGVVQQPFRTKTDSEINNEADLIHFALMAESEPVKTEEALSDSKWVCAMKEELESIEGNNTWMLVDLPKGKKGIGVKGTLGCGNDWAKALMAESEPVNTEEALSESKWVCAMKEELESIEGNNTWMLVDLPKGKKGIGVKGTLGCGNDMGKSCELLGYTDSNWCGDKDDRKSTVDYVFMFGGAPISWCSKKEPVVALSSCEA
ncbi:uncharacterized protein [Cicer arietinum]|uniref:uncharacterized protein n=1 Tax=Cicer arietinum TaxID=3827 RepID=UPI003CC5FBAE